MPPRWYTLYLVGLLVSTGGSLRFSRALLYGLDARRQAITYARTLLCTSRVQRNQLGVIRNTCVHHETNKPTTRLYILFHFRLALFVIFISFVGLLLFRPSCLSYRPQKAWEFRPTLHEFPAHIHDAEIIQGWPLVAYNRISHIRKTFIRQRYVCTASLKIL